MVFCRCGTTMHRICKGFLPHSSIRKYPASVSVITLQLTVTSVIGKKKWTVFKLPEPYNFFPTGFHILLLICILPFASFTHLRIYSSQIAHDRRQLTGIVVRHRSHVQLNSTEQSKLQNVQIWEESGWVESGRKKDRIDSTKQKCFVESDRVIWWFDKGLNLYVVYVHVPTAIYVSIF